MILNDVSKILPVGRASTRVRIKNDITFRGHPLEFVIENKSVCGVWSAVDVQDQRIFFRGIEPRRLLYPCLDAFPIEALIPNFLRLCQVELRKQFVVAVS